LLKKVILYRLTRYHCTLRRDFTAAQVLLVDRRVLVEWASSRGSVKLSGGAGRSSGRTGVSSGKAGVSSGVADRPIGGAYESPLEDFGSTMGAAGSPLILEDQPMYMAC